MLKPGQRFRMREGDGTIFIVVRVSPCAAIVRSTTKTRVEIERPNGEPIAFERSGKPFPISLNSSVEVLP